MRVESLTPDGNQVYLLTPDGRHEINVPFWFRNILRKRKLLKWSREAHLYQITQDYFRFLEVLKMGGGPAPEVQASNPGRSRTGPKKGGRLDAVIKYLGEDCRGPSHARRKSVDSPA